MRKFVMILTILLVGCDTQAHISSQDKIAEDDNNVSYNQKLTIRLQCNKFDLDKKQLKLCEYWKNSGKLNESINLDAFMKTYEINPISDLSTRDYAFYAESNISLLGEEYKMYIFPNSWIRLEHRSDKVKSERTGLWINKTEDYICEKRACQNLFLWDFVDEKIAGENPELENMVNEKYGLLSKKTSLPKILSNSSEDKKISVKIYFDRARENLSPYVIRKVSSKSPLKESLSYYLKGASPDEIEKGYLNNNLGIYAHSVYIKDGRAHIKFSSNDLEINSPEQVMNFTYNVTEISKQFPTVENVDICINNISNYQIAFFANETPETCPF